MKALKGFRFLSFFLFSTSLWGQNSSLSFDGTTQSVSIPSTIYSNGVQNFTIECWVKPSSAAATGTAYHGFVGYQGGSSSTSSRNPSIWMNGGEIHTDMYDHVNNTRYDVLTTTLDLAAEKWFHVAFVKSGTSQFLYINGNLVNSASAPSGAKISGNYLIGAVDNFIDGDLDEVRFWSTARTQTEIREFMQRAPRLNETGLIAYYPFNEGTGSTLANVCTNTSNINGTLNNSPTWTTGSTALAGHNSMIFDGTNDFLDGTLSTTSSTSYTIEFWFSPKKLNVQQNMVYLRDDANTNTNLARTVVFLNSSNQLAFYVANSSGTGNTLTHTNFTVSLNRWYHVACTFNNGTVSIITTGHSIVPTGSSFPSFNFDGTDYLAVGADYSGLGASIFSNIVIDELRIWSTARTTAQVTENRNKYLDLTTTGLLAFYDFNQGIGGGTNTDLSLIYDKKAGNHLRINNFALSSTSSNLITQDTSIVTRSIWYGETSTACIVPGLNRSHMNSLPFSVMMPYQIAKGVEDGVEHFYITTSNGEHDASGKMKRTHKALQILAKNGIVDFVADEIIYSTPQTKWELNLDRYLSALRSFHGTRERLQLCLNPEYYKIIEHGFSIVSV
jgi:hypothetical protein